MERVGTELGRSRPVHSAFYGSFGAHSCPLSRLFRHDRWAVAISSMDFLIGTNQGFRQSLSVIRVHIRTPAPLSPQPLSTSKLNHQSDIRFLMGLFISSHGQGCWASVFAEMPSRKQAGSLNLHTWFPGLCPMGEVEGRQGQVLEPVPKTLKVGGRRDSHRGRDFR